MTTTTYLAITHLVEGQGSAEATVNTALNTLDTQFGRTTGITASATQTQGQQALTTVLNIVTTCGTTNDVVTLPAADTLRHCIVINQGAQTLQVYPASGDAINGGSTDASVTVSAAAALNLYSDGANDWYAV